MSSLFASKDDTLTTRNIVDAYIAAYNSVHSSRPECTSIDGRSFIVNGIQRDRRWIVLEVERLRQEALTQMFDTTQNTQKPASHLFKLLRKLSRI